MADDSIKCKGCSCAGNWLQFVVALVSVAASAFLMLMWQSACTSMGMTLLSGNSVRVGGPLDQMGIDIKALEKKAIADGLVSSKALFPTKGKRVNLLCAAYDKAQEDLAAWTDSDVLKCFMDPKCGPCGEIYKKAYCSDVCADAQAGKTTGSACQDEMDKAGNACTKKICTDIVSMYTILAIVFAVLMLSVLFAGCAVCTCCGGSSSTPAKSCFLPAFGTRSVVGLVGGILAIIYITGPYGRLLEALNKDLNYPQVREYTTLLLLPCYLGILHLVWSEGMIYPDWTVHKASKAAPNLVGGGATVVGTSLK